jgi:hypothetical protein
MESSPNYDQRIIEALEVCRPGSDDVADPALGVLADAIEADPEVAQLYARLQEVDGRVAAAFADVPVPEGLEGRLLERLGVASDAGVSADEAAAQGAGQVADVFATPDSAAHDPGPQAPSPSRPVPGGPRRAMRARGWLFAGGGVAVAVALVVGAMLAFSHSGREYTRRDVLDEAIRFFGQETPEAGRRDEPPSDYPLSSEIARLPEMEIQWRWVSGLLESRGVAYDFRGPRGVRATLYVLDLQVAGLPAAPALRPSFTTGGCSVEAWQEGELLYVLVVNSGNRATYQQFFHPPGRLT